jgi:AbiV family abortive infection protein
MLSVIRFLFNKQIFTMNNFLNISPAECGHVYKKLEDNGEMHFAISEYLITKGYHGAAVSHLILGTEELIKALALFMESKGFSVRRIKGVSRLFSQHVPRHHLMRDFFSVWLFLRPFIKEWERTDGHYSIAEFDREGNVIGGFLKNSIGKTLTGWIRARSNFEWWKNADMLKQRGFYVDYADRLICPDDIDIKQYQEALAHVSRFREDYDQLIVNLNSASEKKLARFREYFKESEMPEIIRQMIERKNSE